MRKVVSGLCAALAVTAGLAFAAPATAEGVATTAGEVHPMVWVHGGWFKNITECVYQGNRGQGAGWWRSYSCTDESNHNPPPPDKNEPWELNVYYET